MKVIQVMLWIFLCGVSVFVSAGDITFSTVRVYPNPWKSGSTQPVSFENLPVNSSISIYTIAGQKVRTIPASSGGTVTWDVANQSIASGVYIYRISAGGQSKKGKIVIVK